MAEPKILTLDELKAQGKELQTQIETRVKELITAGSAEAQTKVAALEEAIKKNGDYMARLEEQIKQQQASALPGLKDEKVKFDMGMFVKALYMEKQGASQEKAWKDAGVEKEAVEQYMKRRDASGSDGTLGGYLIPQEIADEVISLAIARTPILQMGVTILPNLTADLAINRVTGRPTGYWVGENTAPTKSETTFGQTWLRPKKVGAFSKISNRLIYQSRGVADKVIRQELSIAMSLKMNEGFTFGTGSAYQPKGILNQPNTTASSVVLGTGNGGRFRVTDAAAMEMDLDVANELVDGGKFGFLFRPEVKSGMKRERVVMYNGASANAGLPVDVMNPLMSDARLREVLGYDFKTTTQVPKTDAVGTSSTCSKVAFGNWEYFYIGMWRDFVIKVSEHASDAGGKSAFTEDQLYVVAFQEVDCELVRPSAFTIASGAETLQANW